MWIDTIGLTNINVNYSCKRMYPEFTHLKPKTFLRSKQAKLIVRLIPLESFELKEVRPKGLK